VRVENDGDASRAVIVEGGVDAEVDAVRAVEDEV
jgi:hypothetical protein